MPAACLESGFSVSRSDACGVGLCFSHRYGASQGIDPLCRRRSVALLCCVVDVAVSPLLLCHGEGTNAVAGRKKENTGVSSVLSFVRLPLSDPLLAPRFAWGPDPWDLSAGARAAADGSDLFSRVRNHTRIIDDTFGGK